MWSSAAPLYYLLHTVHLPAAHGTLLSILLVRMCRCVEDAVVVGFSGRDAMSTEVCPVSGGQPTWML